MLDLAWATVTDRVASGEDLVAPEPDDDECVGRRCPMGECGV